jgi:RND family efflux transporter MFP subunit
MGGMTMKFSGGNMINQQLLYRIFIPISFFLLLLSCQEKQAAVKIIRPVRTQQVFSTGGALSRSFTGLVQSGSESRLSFKVPGTVQEVAVEIGDKVKKGALLVKLDPTDYEIQVKEAENARDLARASEVQAKANWDRVRALYENQTASKSAYDAARAGYESAHEQDNIAKKRRKLARNQLEYTELRAPVAGAISEVRIEENENVQAGQTVIIFTSGSKMEVQITIPEQLIAQVKEGDDVLVSLDAVADKSFKAIVTEVGVSSTAYSTTYPVVAQLLESAPDIRPGMAAEVSFEFKATDETEGITIPLVAVGEDRLGRFVYVVEPADSGFGIVHKKSVTIGQLESDNINVLEGLKDGDYLVIAGVSKITDGQKVKFDIPENKR